MVYVALPSPIPLSLLLLVASVVFGLAGLVWILPYSIPTPDAWTTVLLLLTVTLGVTGAVGLVVDPGPQYKYVATTTGDCSSIANHSEEWVHEYDNLSPHGQEVFDATLENSPYTTGSNPGFVVETDAGQENCIQKGSKSYRLTVQKFRPVSPGEVILYFVMAIAAAVLSLFLSYNLIKRDLNRD